MFKVITNSMITAFKWGSVIVSTAVVVIPIQAFADDAKADTHGAIIPVQALPQMPADHAWSPTSGFADLIEKVAPAVVHVAVSGVVKSRGSSPEFNIPPGSPFDDFMEQFRNLKCCTGNASSTKVYLVVDCCTGFLKSSN